MRFECVDVASAHWLVGVLARQNRWMHQYSHFECRVRRVRTWMEVVGSSSVAVDPLVLVFASHTSQRDVVSVLLCCVLLCFELVCRLYCHFCTVYWLLYIDVALSLLYSVLCAYKL